MQNSNPHFTPRLDKEEGAAPLTPVVSTKSDKLNPEVEYDVLSLPGDDPKALKDKLNELGADGWQLVAASPLFIFRRMKKADEEKPKSRVGFSI